MIPDDTTPLAAPYWLVGPFRGECALCGFPDARHRVFDAIRDMVAAGDPVQAVADDYGLPVHSVVQIARHKDPA